MTIKDTEPIEMVAQQVARRLRSGLAGLAFWLAIALPMVYLPLLVTDLETARLLPTILVLFGIHVLALVAGQDYHSTTER